MVFLNEYMKSFFFKRDNFVLKKIKNPIYHYVIMFLFCFIVSVSCILLMWLKSEKNNSS